MRFREFNHQLNEADPVTGTVDKARIQQELAKLGYPDLAIVGNKIRVLVQLPTTTTQSAFRKQTLNKILTHLGTAIPEAQPAYSPNPKLSSLGGIVFVNSPITIAVKDANVQGDKSAGVANEAELAALIQDVISKHGSADVTFVDDRNKTMSIPAVTQVIGAGKDVKDRKKADLVLISAKRRLPVSIKKVSADTWESADSAFGAKAREIIDQLVKDKIVSLEKLPSGAYKLSKEIVVEPTDEEAMNAVFGSDINPEGGIVIQSFSPEHFKQEGNRIQIECHAVIQNKEDIPTSHLMVWLLRNEAGRSSKLLGIPGIRILASVLTRAIGTRGTKDVILVDKNGNVINRQQQ